MLCGLRFMPILMVVVNVKRCSCVAALQRCSDDFAQNTLKEVLYLLNIKSFFEYFIGDFLLQRCNAATPTLL